MKNLLNTQILDDLMRQFPIWPSTFGGCRNSEDGGIHTSARGCGLCGICLRDELERRGAKSWTLDVLVDSLSGVVAGYKQALEEINEN